MAAVVVAVCGSCSGFVSVWLLFRLFGGRLVAICGGRVVCCQCCIVFFFCFVGIVQCADFELGRFVPSIAVALVLL